MFLFGIQMGQSFNLFLHIKPHYKFDAISFLNKVSFTYNP